MPGSILLVEDDSAIATVITAALEDEGFDIRRCTTIADRDDQLTDTYFDVMLTDVMLEDGDGLQSLTAVRSAAPEMPVTEHSRYRGSCKRKRRFRILPKAV